MRRSITRSFVRPRARAIVASMVAAATIASAAPGITVRLLDGALWIQLQGSYAGARYLVVRSAGPSSPWVPVTTSEVLCTGDCVARDGSAAPGRTYSYRFDLILPDGSRVSYGPYAVVVPAQIVQARLTPAHSTNLRWKWNGLMRTRDAIAPSVGRSSR